MFPPVLPQGADLLPGGGVRHRVWAPLRKSVETLILAGDGSTLLRALPMEKDADGFFTVVNTEGAAGDRYLYRLDGGDSFPDPFSRFQPEGVFRSSMVMDSRAFVWKNRSWKRHDLKESVIYELHVGTFTREGNFRAAIGRLDHLRDLGVTTLELMPLASFPGGRNWGYDGVMLFAPDSSYGHPDDLRALIDEAHARNLNVWLDLVYNHFGPDGNFLSLFSPYYFTNRAKTPWGDAIDFDGPHSAPVREVFLANAAHWLDEYRFDGFRLDATHAILDESVPHLLAEIAALAHRRGAVVIAEDDRNEARLAVPPEQNGYGLDGLWADDFHHSIRVALTGECSAWLGNFTGEPGELADTLSHGWHYRGQTAPATGARRGTPTDGLRPEQFIHCISNHDQTGNRAFGERLHHLVSPAAHRAACALLCLSPGTPMLFMGQEWAASTPFLFFTDHHDELGKAVTRGRRQEFTEFFEAGGVKGGIESIPDPQSEETFLRSKLEWREMDMPGHRETWLLHREFLALRRSLPALAKRRKDGIRTAVAGNAVTVLRYDHPSSPDLLVLISLGDHAVLKLETHEIFAMEKGSVWSRLLSSNEKRFGGNGKDSPDRAGDVIVFDQPEVLLLQAIPES